MKKINFLTLAIILVASLLTPAFSQDKVKYQAESGKDWCKADFSGLYKGKVSYDVYYHKDIAVDENNVSMNIVIIYTPYGIANDPNASESITVMQYLLRVETSHGRYSILSYTTYRKNGTNFTHEYAEDQIGYIYPLGDDDIEAKYIALAKKLLQEKGR